MSRRRKPSPDQLPLWPAETTPAVATMEPEPMPKLMPTSKPTPTANTITTPAAKQTPSPSSLAGMLALSVRQPWAELIIAGRKTIEYRSQPTAIRGRVLIYASLGRYSPERDADIADEWNLDLADIDAMPRGLIVGSVELANCTESDFGEFEWHLLNPVRFREPIKPERRANPVWFKPFNP